MPQHEEMMRKARELVEGRLPLVHRMIELDADLRDAEARVAQLREDRRAQWRAAREGGWTEAELTSIGLEHPPEDKPRAAAPAPAAAAASASRSRDRGGRFRRDIRDFRQELRDAETDPEELTQTSELAGYEAVSR